MVDLNSPYPPFQKGGMCAGDRFYTGWSVI